MSLIARGEKKWLVRFDRGLERSALLCGSSYWVIQGTTEKRVELGAPRYLTSIAFSINSSDVASGTPKASISVTP
jgi:hypothetical protein